MSLVVGLPSNSYKPITNTAWVRAQLCKLQKGCTRLTAASDKAYQLLVHDRWFSPTSSTTKTGRHDIAGILLRVALKHQKSINQSSQSSKHILASMIYFDSDMSKSTNTVVYFDWKTIIYIYVCGKCRTQFMLPNLSRRSFINMYIYDEKVSHIHRRMCE